MGTAHCRSRCGDDAVEGTPDQEDALAATVIVMQSVLEGEVEKGPATQEVATELAAPVQAGATKLDVADIAGFTVGDAIQIGTEENTIIGFGSILLLKPLECFHFVGTVVRKKIEEPAVPVAADQNVQGSGSAVELKITFQLPDDGGDSPPLRKDVIFTDKPLGLDFDKTIPVTIKRVHADKAGDRNGVQIGWVIVKVNNVDITNKPFKSVYALLRTGLSKLNAQVDKSIDGSSGQTAVSTHL